MRDLVEQLTARLEGGRIIYAHCWGGRGRAGTLGACLLARLYGVSAEEALQRVQRAFDTRTEIGTVFNAIPRSSSKRPIVGSNACAFPDLLQIGSG